MRLVPLMAATLLAAPPLAAQYPTQPPAPLPLEPAVFPPFVEFELLNGLRVVLVSSEKQPVLSLSLSVLGGAVHDPAGKSGTAEMVAGLLTKGAGGRTAEQVSAAIERVGGTLTSSAGQDFLSVNAAVLRDDRALAFSLMADALLRPAFAQDEIDLLRTQTLSALTLEQSDPGAIAARAFARALYGDHPYGRRPDESSVLAIRRDDLLAFHAARVRPAQALLVIAGAIDSTEAHRLVEQSFGGWAGRGAATPPMRPAPQRARSEILLVHRPGSVQSNIVVGNTTWLPTDTRGYALNLANQVLGGASDSRLFQILREEKGWTYGAYSGITRARGLGNFGATAEVRTEVTDSALVEILMQMRRMGTELVHEDEFERAKLTLVGRFPLQIESAQQVAAQVANARLLGLATDYVQTYRDRVAATTREQVLAAARSGMRADAALIVVVGDGTLIREGLERVAPVTMVDVHGQEIAAADLAPSGSPVARPLEIDRSRMMPSSDSFAVMVQGQNFGFQVSQLERAGDGWQYTEQSMLGPIISQRSTVRFSADPTMWSVEQSGLFQGQELRLSVRYGDGIVSGEGVTPGQGGMQPVRYSEVPVPAGTVDDNALSALLPFFPWEPGATFTVSVFASGKGKVEERTLRVLTEEAVSVPLGTFAAYRVSLTGGDAPGTYWIESAKPHRLLKFGPAGAPLEIVRVR